VIQRIDRVRLIGLFDQRARTVVGIDNMLADFFGPKGDTRWNLRRLTETTRNFKGRDVDLRDTPSYAPRVTTKKARFIWLFSVRRRVTTSQRDVHNF